MQVDAVRHGATGQCDMRAKRFGVRRDPARRQCAADLRGQRVQRRIALQSDPERIAEAAERAEIDPERNI